MDPEELEQHRRSIISFSEMLVTAGSILQTVKLNGIPAREAVAFLTIHPSILNLTLSVLHGDYKDICAGLDISGNGPTILPNLGSLSISFDDFDRYNPAKNQSICDAVCRLVESRIALSRYNTKGVIKLEKFALEVAFRKSQAGLDICARLLDKIAVLDEEEEHFFLEVSLDDSLILQLQFNQIVL